MTHISDAFPFAFCPIRFYFRLMKRYLLFTAILATLFVSWSASAAESARAYAARKQAAEQQKALMARVGQLEEALQTYQKEVSSLRAEMRTLRQELSRASANSTDSNSLARKIKEVDDKRIADGKTTLAHLNKIEKMVRDLARTPPQPTPRPSNTEEFEYEIQSGDNLTQIVNGLRSEGFNTSQKLVMQANPKVNWTRLQIGQKIIIPKLK